MPCLIISFCQSDRLYLFPQHHCVLPSFPQPPQTISFNPTNPNTLIMAFPDNTLQIYNVESRQFPAWSKELCNNLPKRLTQAHDPVLGIAFDPANKETPANLRYVLFWGSTWICKVKLPEADAGTGLSKKRRRESQKLAALLSPEAEKLEPSLQLEEHQSRDFKMITQYRPILYVDFMGAGELVVVERPLVDVLAGLPPAYFKHKYGTS